eukprot:TRINITY_DN17467_c0_g1_i1.p1 TRINITY_DN17467_c0_g1~~TRINITY_DN17467_c0_g1_i1.p1  ORF type:complete len:601 (-),score=115.58 TRINITY_DN17467_c0_g1_i1:260-2062(-)
MSKPPMLPCSALRKHGRAVTWVATPEQQMLIHQEMDEKEDVQQTPRKQTRQFLQAQLPPQLPPQLPIRSSKQTRARAATWAATPEEQLRIQQQAEFEAQCENIQGQFLEQVGILSPSPHGSATPAQGFRTCRSNQASTPTASPTSTVWVTPQSTPPRVSQFPSGMSQLSSPGLGTPSSKARTPCGQPSVSRQASSPFHFVAEVDERSAHRSPISVAVVAPGGGTGINGAVYADLGQHPSFQIDIVGRSRAHYDVYPPCWPHGAPAPNLESFAEEVLASQITQRSDCMVFGSRGGQVVLPYLWAAEVQGRLPPLPPTFVINGGCAMSLPTPTYWPENAITFVLIGGQDNFRGHYNVEEYVCETKSHVPRRNKTTVILYVNEMVHMPQQQLLQAILGKALKGLVCWQKTGQPPLEHFRSILSRVSKDGWSGQLMYTSAPGVWEDIKFANFSVGRLPAAPAASTENEEHEIEILEFTKSDELKALWKAAALAARSGGNAPMASGCGNRFAAVVKAATSAEYAAAPEVRRTSKRKVSLKLPVGSTTPRTPVAGQDFALAAADAATPISRALGLPCRTSASHCSPNSSLVFFANEQSPFHVGKVQ